MGEQQVFASTKPVVLQEDAAVLREALASVFKRTNPAGQQRIHAALTEYAKRVQNYCPCTDRALVQAEGKEACLDCGTRHPLRS